MLLYKTILISLCLVSFPCLAGEWTDEDTNWQLGYTALLIADCAQTRYGASHPKQFEEANPILGKHPSKGKIDNTCLAVGLGHFGISYILPKDFRRLWQFGSIVIEATVVFHNASIGAKLEF
mgnify:CR=1 FL=1